MFDRESYKFCFKKLEEKKESRLNHLFDYLFLYYIYNLKISLKPAFDISMSIASINFNRKQFKIRFPPS